MISKLSSSIAAAAAVATVAGLATSAHAQTTLRMQTFIPPVANPGKTFPDSVGKKSARPRAAS